MSMMPEGVRVTRQYIQKGLRGDSQRCALALALGGGPNTDVSSSMIRFNDVCYFTSPGLEQWIKAFDLGNAVSPIELEFTISFWGYGRTDINRLLDA